MNNQRFIAFALIAIRDHRPRVALWWRYGLALEYGLALGRPSRSRILVAYSRKRTYRFLVAGSILAGVAVGILLEQIWGWDGIFLIGLG